MKVPHNHPRQHGHNSHHHHHQQHQQQQHQQQQQQPSPQQHQQSQSHHHHHQQQHLHQQQQQHPQQPQQQQQQQAHQHPQPHLQHHQPSHQQHHPQQQQPQHQQAAHLQQQQQQQQHHQPSHHQHNSHHHQPGPAAFTAQPTAHLGQEVLDHTQSQQQQQQQQQQQPRHPRNPQQSHPGQQQQLPQLAPQPVQQGPGMQAAPSTQTGTPQQPPHHHQQPNNSQHNQIIKHHAPSQQSPMASSQMHPQQAHQGQPPSMHPMHMSISPSMPPQPHWVGPHPAPGQQAQPQQHHSHPQQSAPQQAAHHINHPQGHHMMVNQYHHNPNFIYSQMGHPPFVPPNAHPAAPFEHPVASHQQDSINLPPPTSQQQAVSISNHHPNNVTINQLPNTSVISTASTTGVTNVHHMNSGHMMDPQMANRLNMNQTHYPMMANHYMSPFNLVIPPYMHNMNHYPGAPMPPPNGLPMVAPIRVPGDLAIRSHFDSQGQPTPIPPLAAVSQTPSGKPAVNVPPTTNLATPMTPLAPPKPRERKALAIVDPTTRHVFTVDELKGSPSTPSSQTSKDSGLPGISSKEPSISDKEPSSSEDVTVKSSAADSTSGEVSAAESTPVDKQVVTSSQENELTPAPAPAPAPELEPESEIVMVVTSEAEAIENGDAKSRSDDLADITENLASMNVSTDDEPSDESKDVEDTPEKKTLPNLPYAKGQYSPLNPNGSKRYSIDFLKAVAKEMNIELDNTFSSQHSRVDFVPHYVKGNNNYSMSQSMMRRPNQQVQSKPRKVITTQPMQQEVELKQAEKPWKPELEAEKIKVIETGEMDTTRLLKVFRGHLNKLTPQKYDSLIEKIEALDLDSPERLNSVIDLVFDKAVDEPGFCELYARMCKVIASKDSTFSFHLVKKCQEEFETADLYTGLRVDERKVEIEHETDLAKKKLLSEELYEDMRLRRKKYLGTIKLIGEMYKLGLLLPKIIGLCMSHLISEATNENIECLCSLITTVGANMANEPDDAIKLSLKRTLEVLNEIANSKRTDEFALESRIKFKILDTIDLSRKNWRPRMVENNPKKIEEIREEAKKEEYLRHHQQQQQHHNHSNQSKSLLKNDRDDRPQRSRANMRPNVGKW